VTGERTDPRLGPGEVPRESGGDGSIPAEKAHTLKHSCGTHLSEMGKDVAVIRDWLGHRNVQNTMLYLEVTNKARDAAAESLRDWGRKAA